jgi:hypothetical protein
MAQFGTDGKPGMASKTKNKDKPFSDSSITSGRLTSRVFTRELKCTCDRTAPFADLTENIIRCFVLLYPIFRYNAALWAGRLDLDDLEKRQEPKRRKRAAGRRTQRLISSHVWSPGVSFFLGGYVDDANPSARELQAARAVVPVWHSMCARSEARDLGVRSVGVPGRVGDRAINEPAEWQRF